MPLDVVPNQEFLKFISIQGDKKNFQNLELILNLEGNLNNISYDDFEVDESYPGIFTKVMSNFNKAKSYRDTLDENGKPIKVSWERALKKFYLNNKYLGVTDENADISRVFSRKGLSQEIFDMANELRQKAKEENIPEHILNKPIREESILESIEKIKSQTEKELVNTKEIIEELYDKQFTYEWLSKYDPHNSIMGLFCSCCATITSNYYGGEIAKSSVIAPDVQNLVVKDIKGDIISKGTMYINKEEGYAVINDFEINQKYRNREKSPGKYDVEETSSEEQEREMIFKAFQRGLSAFVKEYDRQNPENPLKQINIGMGYNRLKRQVERFKKETSNLSVPREYSFLDAVANEQYILYKREEKEIENGEQDR